MQSKKISPTGKAPLAGYIAWALIVTGSITIPFSVQATSPAELVGSGNVGTLCAATGTQGTLGAWTHNSGALKNPQAGFDTKWATPSAYTTTGITSTIPDGLTAANLGSLPAAQDEAFYVSYPFTTGSATRVLIDEVTYGDSVITPITMQAQLFSITDGTATPVTGALTSTVTTTDSDAQSYISQTFPFEPTLLASNQPYEMRVYLWHASPTFSGFDDFGISFKPCLAGAPTIGGVTTTSTSASITFTAPSLNGGSEITNYQYSTDGGSNWTTRNPAATTSPLEITGLTAGSSMNIQLRAVTTAGVGVASTSTSATTPSAGALTGLTAGKYGGTQVFDVQRSPAFPSCTVSGGATTFNSFTASGPKTPFADYRTPGTSSYTRVAVTMPEDHYIMFFPSGDASLPWGIKYYNGSNQELRYHGSEWRTQTEVESNSGDWSTLYSFVDRGQLYGAGTEGFLYVSANGTGTFVSNAGPLTTAVTYTPQASLNNCVSSQAIISESGAASFPANTTPNQTYIAEPATVCAVEENVTAFDSVDYSRVGLPSTYTPALTDGVVELTPLALTRAGGVWAGKRLDLGKNFSIDAEFKIPPASPSSFGRADGMAFVLQPLSATSLTSGGGIGYAGTNPSFAVEFDTYQNSADPNNNHIALMKDGNTAVHNAWGVAQYAPSTSTFNLVQDTFTKIQMSWNATTKKFTLKVDTNRDGTFGAGETIFDAVSVPLDTYFSETSGIVYWGFTAATGGQANSHQVRLTNATFTPRCNTPPALTAEGTSVQVGDTTEVNVALEDDETTQSQWRVTATPTSEAVSVTSVVVTSATLAVVTIQGVAGATSGLSISAVDADGAATTAQVPVTVVSANTPVQPPAPNPPPVEPTPPLVPEIEPERLPPTPVAPGPVAITPTPTPTPTPSPTPTGQGGSVLMPVLDATPNVVFGPTNPIPPAVVEVLRVPLAYAIELLTGAPELPKLSPTESLAYENGSPVVVQLVKTDNENGYVLRGDGWEVALEATDSTGQPLRLDESGNIILNQDRFVQFSGTGFAPGSIVKVWLFSDPTELSDVTADANGSFVGKALIPEGIPTGEHTIQLNGLTKDGQLRSVALGVLIQPELVIAPAAPVGFDFSGLMNLLWIIGAGVLSVFFFILWRRRKNKEEEGEIPSSSGIEGVPILASEGFGPSQQFPDDSRRKIGPAAPPNRKRFTFKPKNT